MLNNKVHEQRKEFEALRQNVNQLQEKTTIISADIKDMLKNMEQKQFETFDLQAEIRRIKDNLENQE